MPRTSGSSSTSSTRFLMDKGSPPDPVAGDGWQLIGHGGGWVGPIFHVWCLRPHPEQSTVHAAGPRVFGVLPQTAGVCVLILTAHPAEDKVAAQRFRADARMTKPFHPRKLLQTAYGLMSRVTTRRLPCDSASWHCHSASRRAHQARAFVRSVTATVPRVVYCTQPSRSAMAGDRGRGGPQCRSQARPPAS